MTEAATYLLPILQQSPPSRELTDYLRGISRRCRVVVVDGSTAEIFREAHRAWSTFALHIPPSSEWRCANGKVHGVLTGLAHVRTPLVVIADDDVRYCDDVLDRCLEAMRDTDLVRPQNYFDPRPWHATWDTARILLNRSTGGDFPGTLVVRTDALRECGGYDGDVLFENLQLIRTIESHGGSAASRADLYVRRLPPTTRHFVRQRIRQAYDEFARPARLALALAIVPATAATLIRRRWRFGLAGVAAAIATAEAGRRRAGGRTYFPAASSFLAPLWLLERGVCAWCAVYLRLTGGVRYGTGKIVHAASQPRAA
ncbi:MAG: hypothetical protein JWN62_3173 [Acidimicrobiales bacterium]|nr:hypothetical protein [Acidimicrobiales bacterium]